MDAPRLDMSRNAFPIGFGLQFAVAIGRPGIKIVDESDVWPTKTSSSSITPSQMKVWLEILQREPMRAPFWISTNVPIFTSSPISQP